jgi:hypothetical protein
MKKLAKRRKYAFKVEVCVWPEKATRRKLATAH